MQYGIPGPRKIEIEFYENVWGSKGSWVRQASFDANPRHFRLQYTVISIIFGQSIIILGQSIIIFG